MENMENNNVPEKNKKMQGDLFNELSEIDLENIAREEVERRYENLRPDIDEVRRLIRNKHWPEAVARAKQIENVAKGKDKEKVRDLGFKAQTELASALSKALANAKRERTRNNKKKAREYYHIALSLELHNSTARLALQEMDGLVKVEVSKEQSENLRVGLGNRRDIHRLGNAIYDSEALSEEGKFPLELSSLLREAREFYNKSRQEMNDETTAMRFGNVEILARTVEKIKARVQRGEKTFHNGTAPVPIYLVLREAQDLLRQASEDVAQYELNLAEKLKAVHPSYVYQRLQKALDKPLNEQMQRQLEEKFAEIEQYVQSQKKAESLQLQATQEPEPVRKLGVLLQANQFFNATLALKEQIAQTRHVAISVTQSGVTSAMQQAELFVSSQEYLDARATINEIETQLANWPETKEPKEIAKLQNKVQILRQKIDAKESDWKEYVRLRSDIRKKITDQDQRATGLILFKQVSEDKRFKGFLDLLILTAEVGQHQTADRYDDLVDEFVSDVRKLKDKLKQIKTTAHQSPNKFKVVEQSVRLEIIQLLEEMSTSMDGKNATS